MKEEDFQNWLCSDVLGTAELRSAPVATLSTVIYPLPLLARNPTYASKRLLSGLLHRTDAADIAEGGLSPSFADRGQAKIEVLETLLTRVVLKPSEELIGRARQLERTVRSRAAEWFTRRGFAKAPRIAGLHVRTYYIHALSNQKVCDESLYTTKRFSQVPNSCCVST